MAEEEYIIPLIDAKVFLDAFPITEISDLQKKNIRSKSNQLEAAHELIDVLTKVGSGYQLLVDYLNKKNPDLAKYLKRVHERETEKLKNQVRSFNDNSSVEETDRIKRNELVRILANSFDNVSVDGQKIVIG